MTRLIAVWLLVVCTAGCQFAEPKQAAVRLQWLGSNAADRARIRFSLVVVGHESVKAVLDEFELNDFQAKDNTDQEWILRGVGHGAGKGGPAVFLAVENKNSRATVVECAFECRFELNRGIEHEGGTSEGRFKVSVTFRRSDVESRWAVDIDNDVRITKI